MQWLKQVFVQYLLIFIFNGDTLNYTESSFRTVSVDIYLNTKIRDSISIKVFVQYLLIFIDIKKYMRICLTTVFVQYLLIFIEIIKTVKIK